MGYLPPVGKHLIFPQPKEALMSRGLGRVQRKILEIFDRAKHPAFETSELCQLVYECDVVEKRHRVAVIRALRSLSEGPFSSLWKWTPEFEKADTVWFDHRKLPLRGKSRSPV